MRGDHFLEALGELAAVALGLVAVDDGRERLHRIPGDEHIHLHHLRGAVAGVLVVHRAVALGLGFQLVVEIDEDFRKRQHAGKHHARVVDGFRVRHFAAFFQHELHHVADVFAGHHDIHVHDGFADLLDHLGLGEKRRVIYDDFRTIREIHVIDHGRVGGDHIHIELAPQPFLDDLHVQQAEEAAAETEAESGGALLRESEGGVVDLELAHRRFQRLVIRGIHRIDAGEHHGLDLLVAGQGLRAGVRGIGHRVADLHLAGGFHVRDHVSHIARAEHVADAHFRGEHADLLDLVGLVGGEKFHPLAALDRAGKHADVGDHAAVGVVEGVENGGAQELVRVLHRGGHAGDDGL